MNRKRWIAVAVFVALLFVQMAATPPAATDWRKAGTDWMVEVYQDGGADQIALLELKGEIIDGANAGLFSIPVYNHQNFLSQLEHAFASPEVKGIVMHVNSPGGGVFESDEIHQEIVRLKEEYNKPFVVYMGRVAASGGYYISAPADKIFANRNTLTGSIGVIISGLNIKELMDNYGVKDQTFTSGPNKALMSPYDDMTDEQNAIVQSIVDESYQFFVDVIVAGRGLERERVLEIADGRIYTGSQAQQVGLVDELGILEDAIEEVATMAGVVDPTVITFTVDEWAQFRKMFYSSPSLSTLFRGINPMEQLAPLTNQPSLLYLWHW
ncbi:signal peptide peptidase SppA [Desulfuribacillus alkaliarsenatis]|uniref:Signal peptidase n=1 Tax=Desulfuribacillus alkaliarsenatis TaxID=766136 RepID=A0A1E5G104_9FIRM|nr:signal peptide peptidase SppA [Desulfuribacillus alkaliarsenatis]OEF96504.1 signal peptidase [Desulfuribacillus alkaliarsenatis]